MWLLVKYVCKCTMSCISQIFLTYSLNQYTTATKIAEVTGCLPWWQYHSCKWKNQFWLACWVPHIAMFCSHVVTVLNAHVWVLPAWHMWSSFLLLLTQMFAELTSLVGSIITMMMQFYCWNLRLVLELQPELAICKLVHPHDFIELGYNSSQKQESQKTRVPIRIGLVELNVVINSSWRPDTALRTIIICSIFPSVLFKSVP